MIVEGEGTQPASTTKKKKVSLPRWDEATVSLQVEPEVAALTRLVSHYPRDVSLAWFMCKSERVSRHRLSLAQLVASHAGFGYRKCLQLEVDETEDGLDEDGEELIRMPDLPTTVGKYLTGESKIWCSVTTPKPNLEPEGGVSTPRRRSGCQKTRAATNDGGVFSSRTGVFDFPEMWALGYKTSMKGTKSSDPSWAVWAASGGQEDLAYLLIGNHLSNETKRLSTFRVLGREKDRPQPNYGPFLEAALEHDLLWLADHILAVVESTTDHTTGCVAPGEPPLLKSNSLVSALKSLLGSEQKLKTELHERYKERGLDRLIARGEQENAKNRSGGGESARSAIVAIDFQTCAATHKFLDKMEKLQLKMRSILRRLVRQPQMLQPVLSANGQYIPWGVNDGPTFWITTYDCEDLLELLLELDARLDENLRIAQHSVKEECLKMVKHNLEKIGPRCVGYIFKHCEVRKELGDGQLAALVTGSQRSLGNAALKAFLRLPGVNPNELYAQSGRGTSSALLHRVIFQPERLAIVLNSSAVDRNLRDTEGKTPLMLASTGSHASSASSKTSVELLLNDKKTHVHSCFVGVMERYSAPGEELTTLKAFLRLMENRVVSVMRAGCSINAMLGETPFLAACRRGSREMVGLFLEKGRTCYPWYVAHEAWFGDDALTEENAGHPPNAELERFLTDDGENGEVNLLQNNNDTHTEKKRKNALRLFHILTCPDHQGMTPLMFLCKRGMFFQVQRLVNTLSEVESRELAQCTKEANNSAKLTTTSSSVESRCEDDEVTHHHDRIQRISSNDVTLLPVPACMQGRNEQQGNLQSPVTLEARREFFTGFASRALRAVDADQVDAVAWAAEGDRQDIVDLLCKMM